ncbi:hypothetical protein Trydic_g698 [Trypoxylus dichotomus]
MDYLLKDALRLPLHHPDLNPTELIRATVKGNVAKQNSTFKLNDTSKLAEEEFVTVTSEDWKPRCNHVITIENKYMEQEILTDVVTEELIMNPNADDSSDQQGI